MAPPEDDLKRYERLGDATVSEIPFRLKVAIAELNVVRLRPGMFFLGGIDGVTNYLCGYSNAILELVPSSKRFMDYVVSAYTERGWKPNNIATEPIPQMKKLGWSDDAMIDRRAGRFPDDKSPGNHVVRRPEWHSALVEKSE